MFYLSKMNQKPKEYREPKSQLQRGFEEMCRDSRLIRQSFNSFLLLLSSRIQAKILDLSGVGKGGLLQSSETMQVERRLETGTCPPSFESQDAAAQL